MTDLRSFAFWRRGVRLERAEADGDSFAEPLKRNMPLIPSDTIAGRALVTVIAIMTFLAAVAAGAGVLVNDASRGWMTAVSSEMTIQVKPRAGRNLDADVAAAADVARRTAGVVNVHPYDKAESDGLLQPWLGSGLDLDELPIPRLIVFERAAGRTIDVGQLKDALAQKSPSASLDDHGLWMERLAIMARSLVVIVAVIFLLVLVAMALAVAFATRGAMAGASEIVNVLHYVGAEDVYIARQFQRHFLRLGLRGGVIGGLAAILVFALSAAFTSWRAHSPSGDQIEALFGAFSLGGVGYLLIAVIAVAVGALTGFVSRSIVFRHLRGLT